MNFERGINPKEALDIGIHNSKTVGTLTLMYKEILKEFSGKPHPLKKEVTNSFYGMIPTRFLANVGWGNMEQIFSELTDTEFDQIFAIIYHHYCNVVGL